MHLDSCNLPSVISSSISFKNSSKTLTHLHLFDNHLPNSSIYSWLSNFSTSLLDLDLSLNNLQGAIPDYVFLNTTSLLHLDLGYNQIVGPLKYFGNLCSLKTLSLNNNSLTGQLPQLFSYLSGCSKHTLETLLLNYNILSGSLPDFTLFSSLRELQIKGNKLNGSFPKSFGQLSHLTILDLDNNNLGGSIPDLSVFVSLKELHIHGNLFNGTFPKSIGKLSKLELLDVSSNFLEGIDLSYNNFGASKISFQDQFLCYVRSLSLHLRNNSFVRELPSSLYYCRELRVIDVGHNKFSGKIPVWMDYTLSDLAFLSLRSNQFHGTLPIALCNLVKLQVLDLSLNNITGAIPKCLANLISIAKKESLDGATNIFYPFPNLVMLNGRKTTMYQDHALLGWKGVDSLYKNTLGLVKSIDLSSNKLSRQILEAITSLVGLISLNLLRNTLTGPIPPKLGRFSYLNSLDLSKNLLTGKIPSSTKLQSFDAPAYMGNPELCGPPLPNKCPEEEPAQNEAIPLHDDKEGFVVEGLYVSIFLGFFTGLWGVCGTLMLNRS
ncbi:hypothetical protein EZV62_011027 [Acer yangbiense]|uniref:Leucine-rich repeat-containing N-terminal plant-type domain-containing protein n=1 Tax=Acer yangbiense TaxID=1000413 RepID=A0A5C7I3D7_9ROSI|nr:hypothetical protein EZV62_011027 [Acer yangbiense]